VKITAVELHHYRLPLRAEWATSAGGLAMRVGWLLRLTSNDGRCGYGDCAPLPASGTETPEAAEAALRAYARELIGRPAAEALTALDDPAGCRTPAARCAVETALLDLLSQATNLPLADYLHGAACPREITVNAALGGLMQGRAEDLRAAAAAGFGVFKFKVGIAPLAEEIARLRHVATQLPPGLLLRLDANRAWDEAQAVGFLSACAGLPIDMIEEPLADPQPDTLRRLQARCPFALALDESLASCAPEVLITAPPVRRLVLKPPCIGGLLPALALARRTTAAGLECVVTSSVDSACGVLAAAHLAAGLGNGLAHGLATASWLAEDTGTAPSITAGRLSLPATPGLGFVPRPGLFFWGSQLR